MTSITVGANTTTYVYDGDGNRVKKTVNGVSTYYVGNHYKVTNGVALKYYYFGKQRVAMRTSAGVAYLHSDHLGSTSATSGASVSAQTYYAFGNIRSTTGTTPTDFEFTGQRRDASAGLMYYGGNNLYGRYYDPVLGRFAQPDFLVPDNFNPQDFNRYSYTRNNPLSYTDPSGHCAILCTAIVGAIGGGIFAYGIQVWDNYQKYGMTMESFTQVDGGKIAAGVVGGAVFGATLGLAAPVIAGSAVAIAGTTGGTIIGAAGGGAIAGLAGGQSQRFAKATFAQAESVLTGNGFDGERFLHDAVAAGVLQQDAIVVDSTAGVVSGLVGTGLSRAFVRAGLIPESANSAIKGETFPRVIFMSRDKIFFDLGRTRLYMPADSYDQMARLLQAGLFEEVATLLSNLAAKFEADHVSDELE